MPHGRPMVVTTQQGEAPPGPPTPGMDRRQLLQGEGYWVGWVRTDAGMAGGWHHHGEHDSHIYVLRGAITIEYGPAGLEHVTAAAGDYIFNPAGIVHREITAPDDVAEMFVVRIGRGAQTVNVEGPEAELTA
ncbi:MAG TPA: cupin domain-containing protein [Candidatus Limnocylindrales bacterium]|nr:cupin domain-containing protein [Candidatus Limnocylindrales bacterium]